MLGKLLKYEILATGRVFLPLYIGLLAVAVLASFALGSNIDAINVMTVFLLFALYSALVVVTIVLLIQRFYQNLLKDEGYLMFTLPVNPATLITSKLITTCMWCILSGIVGALAGLIAARRFVDIGLMTEVMREAISDITAYFPGFHIPVLPIILLLLAGLSQLIFSILQVYFCLAVGQLPPFGKYKILFAIIAYIVTSTIISIVATVISGFAGVWFSRYFDNSHVMFDGFHIMDEVGAVQVYDSIISLTNMFLFGATLFNLIFAAAAFIGTSLILQKKLNLE